MRKILNTTNDSDSPFLRPRDSSPGHIFHRHFDQPINDRVNITGIPPHSKLLVRRSAPIENRLDVSDLFTRAQVIQNVVNKHKQFTNEITHWNFNPLAEIDHFPIESVTQRSPLVFLYQHLVMKSEG